MIPVHVDRVTSPALRQYIAAEDALTAAVKCNEPKAIDVAREDVMLAARQAVDP